MEPKRTLHSGNLVRGIESFLWRNEKYMELGTCFVREDSLKERSPQDELGRLGDFRSKEEVAWLEEHFIDFARE